MIKEFIIHVDNQGFYIYASNKDEAVDKFLKACEDYSLTENKDYAKYWSELFNKVVCGDYAMVENFDFHGIRKIIN